MKKDKRLIPKGPYCYDEYGLCPYWNIRNDKPHQYNGYCKYLEKGDWELNQDSYFIEEYTGEIKKGRDMPFPVSNIWDQIKECGINDEIEKRGK